MLIGSTWRGGGNGRCQRIDQQQMRLADRVEPHLHRAVRTAGIRQRTVRDGNRWIPFSRGTANSSQRGHRAGGEYGPQKRAPHRGNARKAAPEFTVRVKDLQIGTDQQRSARHQVDDPDEFARPATIQKRRGRFRAGKNHAADPGAIKHERSYPAV
ncbi:MAG: hypothetical protein R3E87_01455 [Burkholderiaceae bacterium]